MSESPATYFKHLDGVRAIAVLMVVVHHWYEKPSYLHLGGALGVGMFFVLSGFLISNILLKQQIAFQSGMSGIRARILKTFYIRRTLRIFPIYYLYVGVLVLFGIGQAREIWPWLFGYAYNLLLFFTNNWHSGYVEHLWSLAIEEQYYLVWPVLLLSCPPRYNHYLIAGFILLGMGTKAMLYLNAPATQFSKFPVCQFDAFGLGSALALAWQKNIRIPYAGFLMWAFWICSLLVPLKIVHFHGLSFAGQVLPLYYTGCTLFIYLAAKGIGGPLRPFFDNSFVVYLGKISYGIYLYHLFVPDFVKWCFYKTDLSLPSTEVLWVLYSLLTLGICSLSWYLIEQPVNRLKDHFAYKPS
jgi:peptidoglycan/LPS O-acetylase OafA/YrhL